MEKPTQSKRIRNILFLLFKEDPEGFEIFEKYYESKTEKYIQFLKNKLKQ